MSIKVTPTLTGFSNPTYSYDGSYPTTNLDTHTFNTSGIYTVRMVANDGIKNVEFTDELGVTLSRVQVFDKSIPNADAWGCSSLTGLVRINDAVYDRYDINWGDGSPVLQTTGNVTESHVYADNTTRTVTVTGLYEYQVNGTPETCGNSKVFTIFPLATLVKPNFNQLEVLTQSATNGTIALSFTADPKSRYKIYQKLSTASTFTAIDTIDFFAGGIYNKTVTGLNTLSNEYCYKVESYDECGAISSNNEICTINLSASAGTTGNLIKYLSYPSSGNVQYNLKVNGAILDAQSKVLPAKSEIQYNDENVRCKERYCYLIEAIFGAERLKTISASVCVDGIKPTEISPVQKFNATFEDGKLKLFWQASTFPGVVYNLYQINANKDTILIDTTNQTQIFPKDKKQECYFMRIIEKCGKSSFQKTCPVRATGKKDSDVQNSIDWNEYVSGDTASDVSDYSVELYTEDFQTISTQTVGMAKTFIHNPIDTSNQKVLYRTKVTLSDGTIVYSDFVSIIQNIRIFVPSAFTPNGDGINDLFAAKGLFWDSYSLVIYNRWGQVVFSSSDKSVGWDGGTYPPGIYHVNAKAKDKFGNETKHIHQTVTLTR